LSKLQKQESKQRIEPYSPKSPTMTETNAYDFPKTIDFEIDMQSMSREDIAQYAPSNNNEQNVSHLEISNWLSQIGLLQYLNVFLQNGFSTLASIKQIANVLELEEIGIGNDNHQLEIMNSIALIYQQDNVSESEEAPQLFAQCTLTTLPRQPTVDPSFCFDEPDPEIYDEEKQVDFINMALPQQPTIDVSCEMNDATLGFYDNSSVSTQRKISEQLEGITKFGVDVFGVPNDEFIILEDEEEIEEVMETNGATLN